MSNIGVFIQVFNPIHNGHMLLMNKLKDKLGLDKILLVLSNISRNKYEQLPLIEDRRNMCRLATKNCERFEIYDSEKNFKDSGQIFNILQKIKNKFYFDGLHLIIEYGLMIFLNLCYACGNIFNFASIILIVFSQEEYLSAKKKIKKFGKNVVIVKFEMSNISSEYARIRFAQGLSCFGYLNSDVEKYVLKNGVYCQKGALFRECFDASRNRLSVKRFTHCQMVAKAAKGLAKIYHEDEKKAEIAGILHDIVKEKDKKSLLRIIQDEGKVLSPVEKSSPKIWHAIAGAIYCKKWLGIESQEILNAILYHTTARENMTKFEKIIYIADCISDDRKYGEVDFERKLAKSDLDMALLFHLKLSIKQLCEKNCSIHPATIDCYNQLCHNFKKKCKEQGDKLE